MPVGQPQIIQATPSGYLVQFPDGSQQNMSEASAVQLGLVQPTQGLYQQQVQVNPQDLQQPLPRVNELGTTQGKVPLVSQVVQGSPTPLQVAPLQPSVPQQDPGLQPGQSQGQRHGGSYSGTQFVRRTDVVDPTIDRSPVDAALQELSANRQKQEAALRDQEAALREQAQIATDANQAKYGITDPYTGELLVEGQQQRLIAEKVRQQAIRAEFEGVAAEAVARKERQIAENIARIPQEDPRKIWADNDAFTNAAGMLAAAIGGYLSVSTGSGRNLGLEALERSVERSVQAQRTNIESQWKKVASSQQELARLEQQLGDKRAWMAEQAAYHYETLALQAEAEMGKFDSASKQAQLAGTAAAMRQKSAENAEKALQWNAEFAQGMANRSFDEHLAMEKLKIDKGQLGVSWMNAETARMGENRLGRPQAAGPELVLSDRTGITDPRQPDKLFRPRDKDQEKQLSDFGRAAANKNTILEAMKTFLQTDPSTWSPEDRSRYASLASQYVQSGGEKLGRMTDKDAEMLQNQASSDAIKFAATLKSLDSSIKTIEDTQELNRARYELDVQQSDRNLKVRLPPVDPVVLARMGKAAEPRDVDVVGAKSEKLKTAFTDATPRAAIRRQEAVLELIDSVKQRGLNAGPLEVKRLDDAIASLQALPREQRIVLMPDGVRQRPTDALIELQLLRNTVANQIPEVVKGIRGALPQPERRGISGGVPSGEVNLFPQGK